MSHVDDHREGGWWPLQHHDPEFTIPGRRFMGGLRVHPISGENQAPGQSTYGDMQGGLLWEESSGQRDYLHSWFFTGAGAVNVSGGGTGTGGGWLPIRSGGDVPDTRYRSKSPKAPSWWGGAFPRGWTGEVSAGTEEYSQHEQLHPDFWGLIAVNKAGNPQAGTLVYDLTAANEPDPNMRAHLQSLVSVVDMGGAGVCGVSGKLLALQLGKGGNLDGGSGHAVFVDYDTSRLAVGASKGGGPFTAGGAGCQHSHGVSPDGLDMRPLHSTTNHLFVMGETSKDGPVWFDPSDWRETRPDHQHWHKAYLRWNPESFHTAGCIVRPGRWEIEYTLPFYLPPIGQPPPEPPPRIPPPPDPPPFPPPGGDPPPLQPPLQPPTGIIPPNYRLYGRAASGGPMLVGGEGKPAYVHGSNVFALPGLAFKAVASRVGEVDLAASRGAGSILDQFDRVDTGSILDQFDRAPIAAFFTGYAKGDGSWSGFTNARDSSDYAHAAAAGGIVLTPPDVAPQAVLNGTASSSITSYMILPHTVGSGGVKLALALPSLTTGGATSGAVLGGIAGGGMTLTNLDANGDTTSTTTFASGGEQTLTERGSTPTTPATGKWSLYFKSDGLYVVDDLGAVTGPMGTGGGGSPPFSDATAIVKDDADATKLLAFQASGITTGTTRTWTVQDASGTVALTNAGTASFLDTVFRIVDNANTARIQAFNADNLSVGTSTLRFYDNVGATADIQDSRHYLNVDPTTALVGTHSIKGYGSGTGSVNEHTQIVESMSAATGAGFGSRIGLYLKRAANSLQAYIDTVREEVSPNEVAGLKFGVTNGIVSAYLLGLFIGKTNNSNQAKFGGTGDNPVTVQFYGGSGGTTVVPTLSADTNTSYLFYNSNTGKWYSRNAAGTLQSFDNTAKAANEVSVGPDSTATLVTELSGALTGFKIGSAYLTMTDTSSAAANALNFAMAAM